MQDSKIVPLPSRKHNSNTSMPHVTFLRPSQIAETSKRKTIEEHLEGLSGSALTIVGRGLSTHAPRLSSVPQRADSPTPLAVQSDHCPRRERCWYSLPSAWSLNSPHRGPLSPSPASVLRITWVSAWVIGVSYSTYWVCCFMTWVSSCMIQVSSSRDMASTTYHRVSFVNLMGVEAHLNTQLDQVVETV